MTLCIQGLAPGRVPFAEPLPVSILLVARFPMSQYHLVWVCRCAETGAKRSVLWQTICPKEEAQDETDDIHPRIWVSEAEEVVFFVFTGQEPL